MGIELTVFEYLTLPADHPTKVQYAQEQAEKAEQPHEDWCYQRRVLGSECLHHVDIQPPTSEYELSEAA